MKSQSLREMTRAELVARRTDLQDELFNLRMRKSVKTLDNPLRLRHIGREIAQVNTVLREDELGIRTLSTTKTSLLGEDEKKK